MDNNVLNSGSTLQNGKYKILDVLGQGGFGITYLAEQTGLGMKVAVKEFFMKGSCMRDSATSQVSVPVTDNKVLVGRCLKKFKSEARRIASLNNDHIVNIIDIFDENGTSYYVMKHLSGGSLADLVKKKGTLSESVSLMVIRDIADALKSVHGRGLLHLDIKPANILFDERGRAVLIDFGVSKYVDSQQDSTATSSLVGFSRGYAPLEQINATISSLSAATDIYALGGTLYTMITGLVPPDATEVMNQDGLPTWPGGIDQRIVAAIEAAMRPRRADRPQSIDEFLALLPEEKLSEVAAEPVPVGLDDGEDTVVSSSSGNDLSSITQSVRPAGKPLIVIASFMMAASIILAAFTLLRPGGSPVAPESGKGEELQHLVDSLSASAGEIQQLKEANASLQSQIQQLQNTNYTLQGQVNQYKALAQRNQADADKYRRSLSY